MSSERAKAFVLRSYPFGEADRVVSFFTEELGLLRGIAKGSRKLKSRVAGALEPLTLVRLMFVEKPGRDLAVVTGCEAVRSLYGSLQRELAEGRRSNSMLALLGAVGVIAEITGELHADRDPNPAQFRLLDLAQRALIAGIDPLLTMHYFELFTLKLCGILRPASDVKSPAARELMAALLKTHLVNDAPPDYENGALESLGRLLRSQVSEAVGKRLKSYRFFDEIRENGARVR